jgi:hypothetical protein
MSRQVPVDQALSDEDRSYLEQRGVYGSLIERLDAQYDGVTTEDAGDPGVRVDSQTDPATDPASTQPEEPTDNYDRMTKDELLSELSKRKLPVSGTKPEVIARLRAADKS